MEEVSLTSSGSNGNYIPKALDNSMQQLSAQACESSGVSLMQVSAINDNNLGKNLGDYYFYQLSEALYAKIMSDPSEECSFKDMFTSGKERFCQNLSEFLVQRLGGPCYYSDRKGHSSLIAMHARFNITEETAQQWLMYMEAAMIDLQVEKQMSLQDKDLLVDYFRYTAYYLVAANGGKEVASEIIKENSEKFCY